MDLISKTSELMELMNTQISLQVIFVSIVTIMTIGLLLKNKDINAIYKVTIFVIILNFFLSVLDPQYSLLNLLSLDDIKTGTADNTDLWAIRGQIGDIFSGHFTALAFIGLLASLQYQRKSMDQMQTSISQTNDSIKLQNDSIIQQNEVFSLQIKEFEQQTKEFQNQTIELSEQKKEMEVSKIYRQFEFYYDQLEKLKEKTSYHCLTSSENAQERKDFNNLLSDLETNFVFIYQVKIEEILDYYEFIYNKILLINDEDTKGNLLEFYKLYISPISVDKIKELHFTVSLIQSINTGKQFKFNYYASKHQKATLKSAFINIPMIPKTTTEEFFNIGLASGYSELPRFIRRVYKYIIENNKEIKYTFKYTFLE